MPEISLGLIHGETSGEVPRSMRTTELGHGPTGGGSWRKLGEWEGTELAFGFSENPGGS
ncbi:MAG: hypothetical protein HYX29_06890 [Solirubrobacterales bacterium]|nr:hypothetical protein [Solirubrobacterales bacterium]